MHRKGIVHRDLKLDNILLLGKDTLSVCIADFGMACRVDDAQGLALRCGTPGFVGPEILHGHPASIKSDIFSTGALFFTLLTSRMLFEGRDPKETYALNRKQDP